MKAILSGVLLAGVLATGLAWACAFPGSWVVFSYARHPDFPRTEYLNGRLGVVQPGYARSYLVIAFRYLQGRGLNAAEKEQVREYWKDRETGDWDKTSTVWEAKWDEARLRVPDAAAVPKNAITGGRYALDMQTSVFIVNCAEDAYRVAQETLLARARIFGFQSAAVREWRDAQDAVFRNCDGSGPSVPKEAGAGLPAVIRADREYQIAAANLYAARYAKAEAGFRKIATSMDSPWKHIAPYLVVRTLTRAATKDRDFERAETAARELLADPKQIPLHGMTRVLLHRMILASQDESYFHEVAMDLASGRQGGSFREELWDYTHLFDGFAGYDSYQPWRPDQDYPGQEIYRRDELSDWICSFQLNGAVAQKHSVERWRAGGGLAWLVAALANSDAQSPDADELVAAAKMVDIESPGFELAHFHRLRLMVDLNRKAEAREELERTLAMPLTPSAVNLFRGLRMRTAPDLKDYLLFAGRRPLMFASEGDGGEVPLRGYRSPKERIAKSGFLFDHDARRVLNERTPLRILWEAAESGQVPETELRGLVTSAFTRALMLEDWVHAIALASRLAEIGADRQRYLSRLGDTQVAEERRFAGVFYLLHHPEARPYLSSGTGRMAGAEKIDNYRDNWWCPVDVVFKLEARTASWPYLHQDPDQPWWQISFLSDDVRNEAGEEIKKLAATHTGPDYLIAETMRYATAHPKDPRIPEALHYALRSQRYGCVRMETQAASKEAWTFMARHYPRNSWTAQTNYNFEQENVPKIQE
jgi:hypothetical protein